MPIVSWGKSKLDVRAAFAACTFAVLKETEHSRAARAFAVMLASHDLRELRRVTSTR